MKTIFTAAFLLAAVMVGSLVSGFDIQLKEATAAACDVPTGAGCY